MLKQDISNFFKNVKVVLTEHSPEILTGIGIAGMITTTVLAVKATPKAMALIDSEISRKNKELQKEAEKNGESNYKQVSKLNAGETVKTTWKCYIPTVVTGAASIACLIGASSVHKKRNTMLATAYKLSESALTEYREKVIETIGEKKEKAIKDEIDKDRVKNNPSSNNNIIITGLGETLCYDYYSDRHFKSDIDKIKKAINEINRQLLNEGSVSLNDFYEEIGLKCTDYGKAAGWVANSNRDLIELRASSQLDDGVPCLVVDFNIPPKYNFDKFF